MMTIDGGSVLKHFKNIDTEHPFSHSGQVVLEPTSPPFSLALKLSFIELS